MRELLRVNMTDLSVKLEAVPETYADYGGRALTDAVIYHEVPADTDPLGPGNKLVFAPGTLGGVRKPGTTSPWARAAAERMRTVAANCNEVDSIRQPSSAGGVTSRWGSRAPPPSTATRSSACPPVN